MDAANNNVLSNDMCDIISSEGVAVQFQASLFTDNDFVATLMNWQGENGKVQLSLSTQALTLLNRYLTLTNNTWSTEQLSSIAASIHYLGMPLEDVVNVFATAIAPVFSVFGEDFSNTYAFWPNNSLFVNDCIGFFLSRLCMSGTWSTAE